MDGRVQGYARLELSTSAGAADTVIKMWRPQVTNGLIQLKRRFTETVLTTGKTQGRRSGFLPRRSHKTVRKMSLLLLQLSIGACRNDPTYAGIPATFDAAGDGSSAFSSNVPGGAGAASVADSVAAAEGATLNRLGFTSVTTGELAVRSHVVKQV